MFVGSGSYIQFFRYEMSFAEPQTQVKTKRFEHFCAMHSTNWSAPLTNCTSVLVYVVHTTCLYEVMQWAYRKNEMICNTRIYL